MSQSIHQSSAWCQAATLSERLASLRAAQTAASEQIDRELASRRLERWRSQAPFTNEDYFARRLELDGMAEEELFYILGEPVEAIQLRTSTPPWLGELLLAYGRSTPGACSALSQKGSKPNDAVRFLELIGPLIDLNQMRLRERLNHLASLYPDLPFTAESVEPHLLSQLLMQLLRMINRTLVLELNVARLQGVLQGETPEERFKSFLERISQREHGLALLQEYPVLARQVVTCLSNWLDFSTEFLGHLAKDWESIKELFTEGGDPGTLTEIKGGAGDAHRQGRSVVVLKFSSGFRIVYKPRSSAVDVRFQELLAWLNERGDHPPFRTLKIIDRQTYGWVEFVSAQECSCPEEVERFYYRQGGYLALLYALQAVDFHYENLIASGEHPVLIDLESLFHPQLGDAEATQSEEMAWDKYQRSVLRIGLLPQRIWSNADHEGIDVSGLGAAVGQISPLPVPYWEGTGTDQMHIARKRFEVPGGNNRPTLKGTEINLLNYSEKLIEGFTSVYQTLVKYRDQLLASDGPLARFGDVKVRVILRPTKNYAQLLNESYHPNLLRNALDRDRFFDRLWVEAERQQRLARVIPAEREDLLRGDVPVFTTTPDSLDLFSSSDERIENFFRQSGMSLVKERLRELGEADFAQQEWFIRGSLISLSIGTEYAKQRAYKLDEPKGQASRERLLSAARAVGDRLESLALRGENDAAWLGMSLINERNWSLLPLGIDLYGGLSGVAFFLAHLGEITGEARYTALAEAALTTVRRQIELQKSSPGVGGFSGWGGLIYSLTHLSVLWKRPALLQDAQELVQRLPGIIEQDKELDIIGGTAGCLLSLINFYKLAPSQSTLDAAIACGDHLLATAQKSERGIGWNTTMPAYGPLCGFSHGAAGMALALSKLAELTGDERYHETVLEILRYERSRFSPAVDNWPDLRDFSDLTSQTSADSPHYPTTWCHGAPGIGLARLFMPERYQDAEMRAEIDAAIRSTIKGGFGLNHSLCHGDLGNLELLLLATEAFKDAALREKVEHLSASILDNIEEHGWMTGVPTGVESPGLMTGLAGIGYGLLRLADPSRVPSVVALAPPLN